MIKEKYTHNYVDFTPVTMVMATGVMGSPLVIERMISQATAIIMTQVEITALSLNKRLVDDLTRDMFSIPEYRNFPYYITVMSNALSQPDHTGAYFDGNQIAQAKFVDTLALGGVEDVVSIQQQVHPERGTLGGWYGIYKAFREGRKSPYQSIVAKRLDIMHSRGIAPFLELVDRGNERYAAYPTNAGTGIFRRYKSIYRKEMRKTYWRCLALIKMLMFLPGYGLHTPGTVTADGKIFAGHHWVSKRSGRSIFVISGTEKIINNRFTGSGFILNKWGNPLRRFSGWIPKI